MSERARKGSSVWKHMKKRRSLRTGAFSRMAGRLVATILEKARLARGGTVGRVLPGRQGARVQLHADGRLPHAPLKVEDIQAHSSLPATIWSWLGGKRSKNSWRAQPPGRLAYATGRSVKK